MKLDTSSVDDLVYSFTALFAERTIEEQPADLAPYGLVPPRAVARAYLDDGTVKTIRLGDETPTGNTYYLQVEGDPAVYSVWMNHGQHFHWKVADLRSKSLLTAINPEEVSYYKARLRSGQTIEIIEKTPDELKQFQLGFGKYLMVKPYPALRGVDGEKFDPMLQGPASIDVAEFVDDAPADLARYGLDKPWGELLVRDKAGTLHLLFGADRGHRPGVLPGRGRAGRVRGGRVQARLPRPRSPSTSSTSSCSSRASTTSIASTSPSGGTTHAFTLTRATKKATEAGAEDEVVVTYTGDGKELGEDNFKKFYQSVIALSAEGEAPRVVPNAPVVSIRYRLNTGSDTDVTVDLAPYDKIFYASFVEGVGGFALTKVQVDAMVAKMETLLRGEDVKD